MMLREILLLLLLPFLFSCSNETENRASNLATPSADTIVKPKKVRYIEPGLFQADSLQVIFYDDPDGDSLRYSRYFKYTEVGDSSLIQNILRQMDQVYTQQNTTRPCRSEGKIYLLKGEEMLKTVYFSTRADNCSYFYFIKDGNFIYLPLPEETKTILAETKKKARRPQAVKS